MYESRPSLRAYTKSLLKPSETGIEIGGGYNPLATRKEGYSIYSIDHATREELVEKYKNDGNVRHLLDNIQHVDAVDNGREFRDLLGLDRGVDYIVGIHNFEHIPNPIRFLQRCENALADKGKICLVIPDRRGTFDYYRPYSTIGQWMEAYKENHAIHSFSSLYNYYAYATDGNGDYGTVNFLRPPHVVHELVEDLYTQDAYNDAHGFVYTPASFAFLISYIQKIGLTTLGVDRILVPENSNFEFLAILKKNIETKPEMLKEYAINMVGENINHRRDFRQAPAAAPAPRVPLRRQVYERIRASHPVAAKVLYPLGKVMWRMYKKVKP
ncbi:MULTISPECIES: methyltransferase domain-containing protein [unclassified Desulfovibrio]|uniref:class I SAM-dependent methyltransferase n=1 Tax=unclassified Desulfovibrio TaxID=2593640 RepID=UPI0013EAADA2|nr:MULTISPECIES: methyltransferase domain-containing protein [unclassified Desulfovibrio]